MQPAKASWRDPIGVRSTSDVEIGSDAISASKHSEFDEPHLLRGAAFDVEQLGTADQHGEAAGA